MQRLRAARTASRSLALVIYFFCPSESLSIPPGMLTCTAEVLASLRGEPKVLPATEADSLRKPAASVISVLSPTVEKRHSDE